MKKSEQTPVCSVLSVHPRPSYDTVRKSSPESGLGLHFQKQGLNELFFTNKPALGFRLSYRNQTKQIMNEILNNFKFCILKAMF